MPIKKIGLIVLGFLFALNIQAVAQTGGGQKKYAAQKRADSDCFR